MITIYSYVLRKKIDALILKGKTDVAIQLMAEVSSKNENYYTTDILHLNQRFKSNERAWRNGTISIENYKLFRNSIIINLREITNLFCDQQGQLKLTKQIDTKFFNGYYSNKKSEKGKKKSTLNIISKIKSAFLSLTFLFFLMFLFVSWINKITTKKLSHHTITMATFFDEESATRGFEKIGEKLEEFGVEPLILKNKIKEEYKIIISGFKNKEEAIEKEIELEEQIFSNVIPTHTQAYYDEKSLEFNGEYYEVDFKK